MFESNGQSVTFFFVSDVARAKSQTVRESEPRPSQPTPTAPVTVRWVLG